jgi:hypothetical protein
VGKMLIEDAFKMKNKGDQQQYQQQMLAGKLLSGKNISTDPETEICLSDKQIKTLFQFIGLVNSRSSSQILAQLEQNAGSAFAIEPRLASNLLQILKLFRLDAYYHQQQNS